MLIARRLFSTLLVAALIVEPALAQAPLNIGTAAAVRGKVNAVAPNTTAGRVIESGKALYANDHVTTDAAGHLQVLLRDETVFTLGPSSDMVLDEFVYDPNTSTGKVAANFVKGTFRFVTGKVAHKDPDQMKIKLAVGTIGIRGSVGVVQTDANGSTVINAGAGGGNDAGESSAGIFVTNNGQTTNLSRPGFGSTITPGQSPGPAVNMSSQLNSMMGALSVQAGRSSGGGAGSNAGADPSPRSGSIADASGKATASGGALAADANDTTLLANSGDTLVTNANQQGAGGIPDGVATWDQVRTLFQGSGLYSVTGAPVNCTGCTGAATSNFMLTIDFSARVLGDTMSDSCVHLVDSNGDTVSYITPISFASLSGNSTVQLSGHLTGVTGPYSTGGGASFGQTTVTLQNAGGVIAKNALVNMQFTNTSISVSASGSYTAPR